MQFKNPELLYALALLLIPIIIHLFQLRRFQKVMFTNVEFLRTVKKQTRKSRELKKWLVLLTRCLMLACVVLAFAQPFYSKSEGLNVSSETVVYLDNSFSMQARGSQGELMKRAVQDLLEYFDGQEEISLFTNTNTYRNTSLRSIRNELLQLDYSSNQLDYSAAMLKAQNMFSPNFNGLKNLVFISDFQQIRPLPKIEIDSGIRMRYVNLRPVSNTNISIDSAFVSNGANNLQLNVIIRNDGAGDQSIPVSLFDGNELIAKSSIEGGGSHEAGFTLPAEEITDGLLSIDDGSLSFDNSLYFNINKRKKTKVLSVSRSDDNFVKRLFTDPEFELKSVEEEQLNFNDINDQDLIILNELDAISPALSNALSAFLQEDKYVLVIPSESSAIGSYNQFLNRNSGIAFNRVESLEKRITEINFSHPLYRDVFDQTVKNFQYPVVQSNFVMSSSGGTILSLEDGTPFLVQSGNLFVFGAALNFKNSNFINSPLIVPTFYNIGKMSYKLPSIYYEIGDDQTVDVDVRLQQDDILKLKKQDAEFIPQQRSYSNKVSLSTNGMLDQAGIYEIARDNEVLEKISFNYSREEGNLNYYSAEELGGSVSESVALALGDIKSETEITDLWKWFAIFALVFLIVEMLILKFVR